ncbi:acetoacetate--CoA ligase [Noviherbaspirillum galbum]|uniref:Acetoacetate--CoA ligase n=1 Tax=Noviherbaspirillum galbum TaxID=2709383 RepID=A0A6B3SNC3_9BURK|nr:acetoacetate--CoA ligase [Noviherbaspirillum galbum]NEX62314.1 acetoacetate--CoA ligase [Noviherbaspirillum galbum]
MNDAANAPLWSPTPEQIARSRIHDFMQWLEVRKGLRFDDYNALWQWSVDELSAFWECVWQYFDVKSSAPYTRVLDAERMPGATWFEGARLNLAEQVFRFHEGQSDADAPAIIAKSETRPLSTMTWGEMKRQIASVAATLRDMGVEPGDRVVSYMPNIPETVIAFYACASIGAVWSSCSPDMGTPSVLDRFGQIAPKVLFAVDGYRYGGKDFDRKEVVASLAQALPSVKHIVLLPYLDAGARIDGAIPWAETIGREAVPAFEQLPFDHPLWIVYSSGTTGMPKPIVHGHGGVLLEGLKGHCLQLDMGEDDRFMWFTTTGWIMWNSQVTGLLTGSAIAIYDGNPGYPDLSCLWRFAEEAKLTMFGAGAAYFGNCMKANIRPKEWVDTGRLRAIGSTGSPLPAEAFHWVYEEIGQHVLLASISGGTDIAASFVGASPIVPLHAGEMQCRGLGIAVYAVDEQGRALVDEVGELVVTKPMPSMPLYFWNDPEGRRYRESYFDTYPGWWRHGDWLRITPRGGAVIYGRSDTTINRHGIRMGTSEIYRVVENLPEVLDSLVVDLEYLGRESYMPLFVVLRPGVVLDDALRTRINAAIRGSLSARHVPNDIFAVSEIPRTLTGKKMELPVKKLLLGMRVDEVANPDAMSNPGSLAYYIDFAAQRQAASARG